MTDDAINRSTRAADHPAQEADPLRWRALGVVLVASFMVLLDISIVNVAIPTIQRSLGATFAQIQLVFAGYQLSYAVMLITGGRLGDIFGRKRLFLIGVAGFTVASALCGLAQSPDALVWSRVIQGLFAALMYPQVLAVIQVSFPPKERGAAFGIFGAVIGVATISGPLVGGLLIEANVLSGWRPIFLVNVPIGIGAMVAAVFLLKESKAPHRPKVDLPGVALVTAALGLLTYPLVQGREAGWPTWAFVSLAASVPMFALFVAYIVWRKRQQRWPLIDPGLFTDRAFVVGLLICLAFFAGIPAFFLTFSLYLQIGLGFGAMHAGLTTVPFAVASGFASGASIRLAPKLGKRILMIGITVLMVGMLLLIADVAHFGVAITSLDLVPVLAIAGAGLGLTVAPLLTIILANIAPSSAGAASGVLTTVQQVGGALGVALVGVVFFGLLGSHAPDAALAQHPTLQQRLVGDGVPAEAVPTVLDNFDHCFADRAKAADPSAEPASCRAGSATRAHFGAVGAQVGADLGRQAGIARSDDFGYSMRWSLLFELGVWALTLLCIAGLPGLRRAVPAAHVPESA